MIAKARVRLNKYVAQATGLSRRAADLAITEGKVQVDGAPAELGVDVRAEAVVTLAGQVLSTATYDYVIMNKPTGYVSSRSRQGSSQTLYDLLPASLQHLKIAGRLDRDSCGLVLLTNDGDVIQTLSHPSNAKSKLYRLTLNKPLTRPDRIKLAEGVELSDGTSIVQVLSIKGVRIEVSISEGRNRQLRRTFDALDYKVLALERFAIGDLTLDKLKPGAWQNVAKPEGL